jgi:N-acetyl sugar amidotransferase
MLHYAFRGGNMITKKYQICARCVMDNSSDDTIVFDENGFCNYCTEALKLKERVYFPNEEGREKLNALLNKIKSENKRKKYDCIIGVSGGLDSSYLLFKCYQWGLRTLVVHVDDGFDSKITKSNLNKLINKTGFDYIVEQPDSEQFNDLTRAFFLAGVPNVAIPQDNILFAVLYRIVRKYGMKTLLSGGNFALECILQRSHTYRAFDVVHIKAIHKIYGRKPIDKLPLLSDFRRTFDRIFLGIETVRPLNFIEYNRNKAIEELNEFCGFEYYKRKHLENDLTKFIQLYWFYHKFGVDKRRSHLSSMIVSGQMSREEALEELKEPIYDESEMLELKKKILCALDISDEKFEEIMKAPPKEHTDYKTDNYHIFQKLKKFF